MCRLETTVSYGDHQNAHNSEHDGDDDFGSWSSIGTIGIPEEALEDELIVDVEDTEEVEAPRFQENFGTITETFLVYEICPHDILLTFGEGTNFTSSSPPNSQGNQVLQSKGNAWLTTLIERFHGLYEAASARKRTIILQRLVRNIRARGGRFLLRSSTRRRVAPLGATDGRHAADRSRNNDNSEAAIGQIFSETSDNYPHGVGTGWIVLSYEQCEQELHQRFAAL